MIEKLLQKQLHSATDKGGALDMEKFLEIVRSTYEDYDRTLELQNNATQLMSDELNELNKTLRKEQAEQMAESQKRFELAVEGTNDGIWDWDVLENSLWFSSRAKTMLGYTPDEMQTCGINDWYALVDKQDIARAQHFIYECLSGNVEGSLTLKFQHISGGTRHIMCRASAVKSPTGRVVRLVGVHTDITSFIIMNEELKRTKEAADAANAAKSDFLANMSHELRTPLNSIIGMTKLLLETPLNEQQDELASTVVQSSLNLLEIVNDILDLSKIEAGEMDFEKIGFDIVYIFESITQTLGHLAREKRLEMHVEYDKDSFSYLVGDPLRVTRIIINLVSNAIKYTDRGSVYFRADCEKKGDGKVMLNLEVEDTGIGIAPNKIKYIFEKFVQVDTSTTRKYGGTGLGLAITKQLIEMMEGEIYVESVVGKGSTFYVSIPFDIAEELTVKEHQRIVREAGGGIPIHAARVLVAEDHPMNQLFVRKLLEKFGCKSFEIVENGSIALEKYQTGAFDLIFMDCHMPEKNGYDTTRAIRALEKEKGSPHIPIIAMTANAMVGEKEKCLRCGMDDYISKPINVDELKTLLGQWVSFDEEVRQPAGTKESDMSGNTESVPVNLEQLRTFTEGDADMEQQFLQIFREQSDKNMVILTANRNGEDPKAWVEAAHMFKGGAGGIGAETLRALCDRAQHFAGTPEERKSLFTDIDNEYNRVKSYLDKIRPQGNKP